MVNNQGLEATPTEQISAAAESTQEVRTALQMLKELGSPGSRPTNPVAAAPPESGQPVEGAGDRQPGNRNADRVLEVDPNQINRIEKIPHLSAFERSLVNGLSAAVETGNLTDTRAMLEGLAGLPAETQQRVLSAFKRQLEAKDRDGLTHVSWETGRDNHGNQFMRLHIYRNNDHSKSSGASHVMIGSDGMNAASHTRAWNAAHQAQDPGETLGSINSLIALSQRMNRPEFNHRKPTTDETRRVIQEWQRNLRPGDK